VIAMLRGRLLISAPGEVVIDVGGVGYQVLVPTGDVRAAVGDEITLHTHLAVREDALTLYGFVRPASVSLFRQLLAVSGVGPKLALAAIATLGPESLRRAVVTEDVRALTAVPGVGKKGAQRMILELRERLGALGVDDLPARSVAGDPRDEVRAALATLGYGAVEVEEVVRGLGDADGSAEEQLRQALRLLGSR
jgi:holliday junction DNA helicase RuvA